jgi:hypothetical protein
MCLQQALYKSNNVLVLHVNDAPACLLFEATEACNMTGTGTTNIVATNLGVRQGLSPLLYTLSYGSPDSILGY